MTQLECGGKGETKGKNAIYRNSIYRLAQCQTPGLRVALRHKGRVIEGEPEIVNTAIECRREKQKVRMLFIN